jgi:hypothetical protein
MVQRAVRVRAHEQTGLVQQGLRLIPQSKKAPRVGEKAVGIGEGGVPVQLDGEKGREGSEVFRQRGLLYLSCIRRREELLEELRAPKPTARDESLQALGSRDSQELGEKLCGGFGGVGEVEGQRPRDSAPYVLIPGILFGGSRRRRGNRAMGPEEKALQEQRGGEGRCLAGTTVPMSRNGADLRGRDDLSAPRASPTRAQRGRRHRRGGSKASGNRRRTLI